MKNNELTQIKVLHHGDLDGFASALMFKKLYLNSYISKYPIEFCNLIDYTIDVEQFIGQDENTLLVFLDYSFSNKNNIKAVRRAINSRGCKMIWIDHHETSFDNIGLLSSQDSAIYLSKKRSGAYLTWRFLYVFKRFKDTMPGNTLTHFYKQARQILMTRYHPMSADNDNLHYDHDERQVPLFIRMIDAYDRFDKTDIELFRDGVELSQWFFVKVTDLEQPLFVELFGLESIDDDCVRYANVVTLDKIRREARNIQEVMQLLNNNFRNENKFEIIVKYIDNVGEIKEASAICCNRQMNSIGFGDDYNKYDITIPFYYTGSGKWTYSMYTKKTESIHVGNICKVFGGGGHAGAAGFTSDECVFDHLDVNDDGIKILDATGGLCNEDSNGALEE